MRRFHQGYFEGLYLKHTDNSQTLAFIPAIHTDTTGKQSASLQIVTDSNSWTLHFDTFSMMNTADSFFIRMGNCVFTQYGCRIQIDQESLHMKGRLVYGTLTPLRYDIMGPFKYVPGMECRHLVFSMLHSANGSVAINGDEFIFRNGAGYIEGDRGRSFPEKYVWTQFHNQRFSIFMAAAGIPLGKCCFHGCLAVIWHKGKELRLATYLGAKVVYASKKKIVLRQRDVMLAAELLESSSPAFSLAAPVKGTMERTIVEQTCGRVKYQMWIREKKVMEFVARRGSFEGEW